MLKKLTKDYKDASLIYSVVTDKGVHVFEIKGGNIFENGKLIKFTGGVGGGQVIGKQPVHVVKGVVRPVSPKKVVKPTSPKKVVRPVSPKKVVKPTSPKKVRPIMQKPSLQKITSPKKIVKPIRITQPLHVAKSPKPKYPKITSPTLNKPKKTSKISKLIQFFEKK